MNTKFVEAEFDEALKLLQNLQPRESDPNRSAPKNRRRAARIATRLPVAVATLNDKGMSAPKSAEVRDISAHGLSVAIEEPLALDSLFVVQMPARKKQKADAPLVCRAVHTKKGTGNTWLIGAEFVGRLPDKPVAASIPAPAEAGESEMDRIRKAILK